MFMSSDVGTRPLQDDERTVKERVFMESQSTSRLLC